MTLKDLGYNTELEQYRNNNGLESLAVGRVISEHKERYIVKTATAEYEGEIIGNLRYTAQSRADFPAVGDWVSISEYDDDKVLIHAVFPRKSIIERQSVEKKGEKQIIATNIDYAFIVLAVDRDFSINRIERYLTLCNTSNIKPIILLNKTDLADQNTLQQMLESVQSRIKHTPILLISNQSKQGIEDVQALIEKQKTYCLLGSSGVGKSSLLNTLLGEEFMKTDSISEFSERGRHITTHRELKVLDSGGILIDNPGMREVGITDSTVGLQITFEDIVELAEQCKFNDCTHTSEKGCAILEALDNGEIDENSYENYLKMEREKEHFEATTFERRKKDKDFGKMIKNMKKSNYKKY